MYIRIKQLILKSMYLKVLLVILLLVVLGFYFKIFFTTGVYYEEAFLKKQEENGTSRYSGWSTHGDLAISVLEKEDASKQVTYNLPNNIHRQYAVTTIADREWNKEIQIKDTSGSVIFEGNYSEDNIVLIDKNGEAVINRGIRVLVNGESPFKDDYVVPLKHVADMAFSAKDTIRGEYPYLIVAFFLFIITAIDYKFPLLFFRIRNFLEVEDPEPHDFYKFMQKLSWRVLPVIGIILMIVAVVG